MMGVWLRLLVLTLYYMLSQRSSVLFAASNRLKVRKRYYLLMGKATKAATLVKATGGGFYNSRKLKV